MEEVHAGERRRLPPPCLPRRRSGAELHRNIANRAAGIRRSSWGTGYGTVPRRPMNLSKIRHILELGNRTEEAKLVKDYVRRVDLQTKAKELIRKYDLLLNGDPNEDDGFDSNILEEFIDSDDSDIIPQNYSANQRNTD